MGHCRHWNILRGGGVGVSQCNDFFFPPNEHTNHVVIISTMMHHCDVPQQIRRILYGHCSILSMHQISEDQKVSQVLQEHVICAVVLQKFVANTQYFHTFSYLIKPALHTCT